MITAKWKISSIAVPVYMYYSATHFLLSLPLQFPQQQESRKNL